VSGALSYSALVPLKVPASFHCEVCGEPIRPGRRYFFSYVAGEGAVSRWCERNAPDAAKAAVAALERAARIKGTAS
jgi:hypothetical protein